jgi:hypothetical protein
MKDSTDRDSRASQQQARENAQDARQPRKSDKSKVDDDSSVMQSMVAALAAPVEGALDSVRERERFAKQGRDLGPDQVGGISGQRAQDIPTVSDDEPKGKVPQRPDDVEAEPIDTTDDHAPGGRR